MPPGIGCGGLGAVTTFFWCAGAALHKLRPPSVFLLNVPHDVQAGGLPIVLLRHFLTDQHQLAIAGQGRLLGIAQVMHHIHSPEMIRLGTTSVAAACLELIVFLRRRWRCCHLLRCRVEQRQLVWIDLLARTTVELAEHEVQTMLQLFPLLALTPQRFE